MYLPVYAIHCLANSVYIQSKNIQIVMNPKLVRLKSVKVYHMKVGGFFFAILLFYFIISGKREPIA